MSTPGTPPTPEEPAARLPPTAEERAGCLTATVVLSGMVGFGVLLMLHAVVEGGAGALAKGLAVVGLAGLSFLAWCELRVPWWVRVPWSLVAAVAVVPALLVGALSLDPAGLVVLPATAVVLVLGVPTWLARFGSLSPRRAALHLVAVVVVATVFAWAGPPWVVPPERFTGPRWRTTRQSLRIGMAHDAVERGLLVGRSEAELRRMLGPPGHASGGHLIWLVGQGWADPMLLDVRIEDGRAAEAVVRSG